jgi:hypothetical protein
LAFEILGRYVSYEYQKIDEQMVNRILECGLSYEELDEIYFEDGDDCGVIWATWEVDGVTMTFEFDSSTDTTPKYIYDGSVLIREEAGRICYQTPEIQLPFKAELLTFPQYSAEFSDYSFCYAKPMYDGEELEYDDQDTKASSLILISPDRECYSVKLYD